jgi:hypothetical protein
LNSNMNTRRSRIFSKFTIFYSSHAKFRFLN